MDSSFIGDAKLTSPQQISLKQDIASFFLLNFVRLNLATLSYLYHDWQSFIILCWVCYSFLLSAFSVLRLAKHTQTVFLPILILIVLQYFVVNIGGVVKESLKD